MIKNIITTTVNRMKKICKPQRKFIETILLALLSSRGKMNFRNMSRYCDISEKTFSRHFEKPFDFAEFNRFAFSLAIEESAEQIIAFDPSFIKKSGKKTVGKDSFWNGSAGKAEKGLELGLLSVVDVTQNTAYSLVAEQTFTDNLKEGESRIDVYLKQIVRNKKYFPPCVNHVVVDAYFTKQKFVDGVVSSGLDIVGKLRIDANLRYLYSGEQKVRGRKKVYGEKVNIDDISKWSFFGEIKSEKGGRIKLYTAILNHASLRRNIKVILLQEARKSKKAGVALLFSTNLSLSPLDIYRYYKARYQIEFLFRDAKQFAGLADCQARSRKKLHFHFNASLAALNLAKIENQLSPKKGSVKSFSMADCKTRNINERFALRFFSMLKIDHTLKNIHPIFQEMRNYGVIQN